MTSAAESVKTCLSLYSSLPTATLIAIEEHHGYKRSEILAALENLILSRAVCVAGDSLSLVERKAEEIPAGYLAAADAYRKAHGPSWRERACVLVANLWQKCWGGLVLIVATTGLTIGLCAI